MLKTFSQSYRLRNAYRTNGIIWSLKSIPLIRKILPSALYASPKLKLIVNILGVIWEICSAFLGKLIYLLIILSQIMIMKATNADSFAHLMIFLTLIGGMLNTSIFEPTKDKFYAIFLMRMNAKKYTLTNYTYFLIRAFIGFLVLAPIFGLMLKASIITCLIIPIYVICVKLCFTAFNLNKSKKTLKAFNENKPKSFVIVSVIVLLTLSALPYWGFALNQYVLLILTAILIIPSVFAGKYIYKFDYFRPIYKELLKTENYIGSMGTTAEGTAVQLAMRKKISTDTTAVSDKKGYKYLNELFMKRHSKILTKSAKRISLCSLVFFVLSVVALYIFPNIKDKINELLLQYLPYFLFVMYLLNRGKTITQAMFMNCDHSMLAYRFYRQPKAILNLFKERLKYVIVINLIPALVIGLGLPTLLYFSGGTSTILNYFILFFSIIAMSVFFSVHNMVLYYLLQPYNVNLEAKSATYSILNFITYFVSYLAIQLKAPTLIFGICISAFCIIYSFVALILAYRLAPKTFKLRN